MKLYRNAIILVVVLGLLVGAYFFIQNKKAATPDVADASATADVINVITVDQAKINSLEFNSEIGSVMLKKQDKAWTMNPSSEFPIDNTIAEASATDMSTIVADKVIEEKATDLVKYGLDKPAIVKVGLTDGSFKEIEIGSSNPTNEGIYVKNKGESKVYLIGSYYESKLKLSRGYFAKKDILPVDPTTLNTFAYEKNGEMQYAISITSGSAIMEITAPIKEEAEPSKISPMLAAVVQLVITDVVDENPTDLAKYGLDKPAYAIVYGDANTSKKILFGKELKKGSIVYAKFPEGKSVFTIDATPLTFLDVKLSDILNTFIYLPNIADVNLIELSIDGKKIVSDITTNKDNKDEDKFKVDGKDANMENEKGDSLFRAFYTSMIGITMTKYEPGAKPSGTPDVTIKYFMKPDSKAVTIDFISKDSNYYYAMKNGVYTNRVILKSKFDEADGIREAYKALKKAIDEVK
ncbi:MAG TPA: DUF4340 domain-containing protein [Ruminiclostridium sp.]